MISVQDAFLKFKSRLELTTSEQEDASRRQNRIRDLLCQEFDVQRDILTGSYSRHTKTKPLKDVDIFCILGDSESSRHEDQPSRLLSAFQGVLRKEYGDSMVCLQRRSVQIDFGTAAVEDDANGKIMSFDVVPAFSVGSHYEIPDTRAGKWVKTDPEIHKELSTKANKEFSGQWVPMVKMIKKWNEAHNKPVNPSFLLEVMALRIWAPPFSGGYPYELKSYFATAAARIAEEWADPAGLGPPVSDQMDAAKIASAQREFSRAEEQLSRAMRFEREGRNGEALREWRGLFGPLFPLS